MTALASHILAIICLIAFAAFFSAAETALATASRPRLGELARRGQKRAVIALELINAPARLHETFLLGRVATYVPATLVVSLALFKMSGITAAALAAVLLALVLLFLAELLPRTFAAAYPDRVTLALAPSLRLFVAIFAPPMSVLQSLAAGLLRGFGARLKLTPAPRELRIPLDPKEASDVKNGRDMLGGLLELQNLEVSDIMVHRTRMTMIDASEPVDEIVAQLLKSGRTRIPVWRDKPDNIIGVLHAKNLFAALQKAGGDTTKIDLEEILSPPWFVPDTRPLTDQLNAFLRRKTHFAIVVDEYGEVQGLVTLEDIIEEIVGDIKDEHDAVATGARRRPDGSFVIEGGVPVRDLNRAFDWNLPDDEATTLAGLVIHEARMIPETGQTFNFHGFQFEILKKRKHQLTSLKVTPLART